MRLALAAGLLAAAAAAHAAAQEPDAGFASALPGGVGDVSRWEVELGVLMGVLAIHRAARAAESP